MRKTKFKCRCYINLKYYANVIKTGQGTLRGYKPCPVHDKEMREDEDKGSIKSKTKGSK